MSRARQRRRSRQRGARALRLKDTVRALLPFGPRPKVSALVSVYRAADWIEACLEDLTSQTLFQKGQLEIVIVDANSPDGEKSVIDQYRTRFPQEILYRRTQERISLYAAWNVAIGMSHGRYLTSANVDDKHEPEGLEKMANFLDQSPEIGLVYGDQWITENPRDTYKSHVPTLRWDWPDYDRQVLQRRCIIGPQPLWRRALHYRYGMFDETFLSAGDWEFWLRLSDGVSMRKLDSVMGLYYRNAEGLELSNPRAAEEVGRIRSRYGLDEVPAEATIPVAVARKSETLG